MNITVRLAREVERSEIALCIAEGFERDFSFFRKDMNIVAKALESGIRSERFYVALYNDNIVGVAGISDCTGRAVYTDWLSYRKCSGLIMGTIAKLVLKKEFEMPLPYPMTTGFIEFVATRKSIRRSGVASNLLKESMRQAGYKEYILDVIEENRPAVNCYTKLGFTGFKKTKKKNGYTKLFMKLTMQAPSVNRTYSGKIV